MKKWYVGIHRLKPHNRFLFKHDADTAPTSVEYPYYMMVIGPFVTKRGATFMRDYGQENSHCQTVADAERLAKMFSTEKVA